MSYDVSLISSASNIYKKLPKAENIRPLWGRTAQSTRFFYKHLILLCSWKTLKKDWNVNSMLFS
jgi:hypothetical protein